MKLSKLTVSYVFSKSFLQNFKVFLNFFLSSLSRSFWTTTFRLISIRRNSKLTLSQFFSKFIFNLSKISEKPSSQLCQSHRLLTKCQDFKIRTFFDLFQIYFLNLKNFSIFPPWFHTSQTTVKTSKLTLFSTFSKFIFDFSRNICLHILAAFYLFPYYSTD